MDKPDPTHQPDDPEPRATCGARRRDGQACTNPPMRGATRCRMHGGSSPQARAAAERRVTEQQARRDVARYGGSLEVDPSVALLQEVHRSAAAVAYLQQSVLELDPDDVVSGNGLVKLYQEERDRLARVSKAAIDAGCAQSMVEVFQQVAGTYVQLVGRVLDRVAGELELPEGERERLPELTRSAFEAELSLVEGGNVA